MPKLAFIIVVVLLSILATHSHGQAETVQLETKTKGKLINNTQREQNPTMRAAHFQNDLSNGAIELYGLSFNFSKDQDGDGYFHKFSLSFDLDTSQGPTQIYVVASLMGLEQKPLFTTEPYWVYGQTGEDTYQTTVLLSEGYPNAEYDLSLAVYAADSNQLLAQFSQDNSPRFSPLFLEDARADHIESHGVSIYQLGYSLSEDWDNDGFYTRLDVDVDVDAPNQSRWIYLEFILVDYSGYGELLSSSPIFQIHHLDSSDQYQTRISLESGYSPQDYKLVAKVYDANTHQLLLESQVPHSNGIPLESFEWDDTWHHDSNIVVEEEYFYAEYGAGGSMGLVFSLMLLPFLYPVVMGKLRQAELRGLLTKTRGFNQ